ncbi:MAG: hypothetical protein WA667_01830 [Candidatus Nitrosopolaris sp.]
MLTGRVTAAAVVSRYMVHLNQFVRSSHTAYVRNSNKKLGDEFKNTGNRSCGC